MSTNSCPNFYERKQFICTNATIEMLFPKLDEGSAIILVETGELIGIASWNDDFEFPNVYVSIRMHLSWINFVIYWINTLWLRNNIINKQIFIE